MRVTHWTRDLLSERARLHEAARWEAEAEITELEAELRDVQARLAKAERRAQRRCGLAYTLRGWRDAMRGAA
jgi:hypothetical protein